jgi:glycosyltransferase involved in cell wall biosynthesis
MPILILTNFDAYHSGYSLCGCVQDQIAMCLRNNVRIEVAVSDRWGGETSNYPLVSRDGFPVHPKIPSLEEPEKYERVDELSSVHEQLVNRIVEALHVLFKRCIPSVVFTQDWIFSPYFLPYAEAIRRFCAVNAHARSIKWFHWVHSVCVGRCDWWDIGRYEGNHTVVYPTEADGDKVRMAFGIGSGDDGHFVSIPHVKDLRTWNEWGAESCAFVDEYPGVMSADMVQVYPASSDRLTQKGLSTLISLFSRFKDMGLSVCLVIANQWVTRLRRTEDIDKWQRIGKNNGLSEKELIFTSRFRYPQYESGIPKRMLRELMQCSSIFIYPTHAESFGLVYPEVSLSSGCLCVLNDSVNALHEVGREGSNVGSGVNGRDGSMYLDFGPKRKRVGDGITERERFDRWARDIVEAWESENGVQDRVNMRQRFNMDTVWRGFYEALVL